MLHSIPHCKVGYIIIGGSREIYKVDYSDTFLRQISAMRVRLESLYSNASTEATPEILLPSALKELGIAAEELEVANEELLRQNDQMATEMQQAVDQLQHYQNLFLHAPEAYLVTTLEGKILDANQAACRFLNLASNLLTSKLLVNFVPSDYRSTFRTELNRSAHYRQPRTWTTHLQPRDGVPLQMMVTTSVVSQSADEPSSLYWILRESQNLETGAYSHANHAIVPNALVDLSDRTIHRFTKGEVIPLSNHSLWLVREGLVRLSTLTEENEEVLLGLVGSNVPFGIGSLFLPVYQATALSDVQLLQIGVSELKNSAHLTQLVLSSFQQRLQQAELLLNILGQRRVNDRLYHLLQFLKREIGETTPEGTRLKLRLTHEDLANACCTTRVTMTRLLGDLQRQRKIAIDNRFHIILTEKF